MLLSLLLVAFLQLTAASDVSRYCYSNPPFTGYKFQIEKTKNLAYTLVYCNDNKLIFKSTATTLNGNFPMGNSTLTVTKSSSSILPNKLVGSLLLDNRFLVPLLTDNMFKSWIEIDHHMQRVLHIPVLTSPPIDSKYYSQ